jgi:hypothetical protein
MTVRFLKKQGGNSGLDLASNYYGLDDGSVDLIQSWIHRDGYRLPPTGALAGYAIGLLADEEPALHDALVASRGSIGGLRDVAKILNSIQPGLYKDLRKLQYNKDDFSAGLKLVKDALKSRVGRKPCLNFKP